MRQVRKTLKMRPMMTSRTIETTLTWQKLNQKQRKKSLLQKKERKTKNKEMRKLSQNHQKLIKSKD